MEGFLGASSVGVDNFSVLGQAYFPAVNLAGKTIDRLVITVQSNTTGLPGVTFVDNIVLEDAPPAPVPALSQWGMIIFAALMALSFWWYGRMRLSRRR